MGCCFSRGRRTTGADPEPFLEDSAGNAAAQAAHDAALNLQAAVAKAEAKRSSPAQSEEAIGTSAVAPPAADVTEVNQASPAAKREEDAAATLQQGISAAAAVLQQAAEPAPATAEADVAAADTQPSLLDVDGASPDAATASKPQEPLMDVGLDVDAAPFVPRGAVPSPPAPAMEAELPAPPSAPPAAETEQHAPAVVPDQQERQPAKQPAKSGSQKRGGGKKKGRGGRK